MQGPLKAHRYTGRGTRPETCKACGIKVCVHRRGTIAPQGMRPYGGKGYCRTCYEREGRPRRERVRQPTELGQAARNAEALAAWIMARRNTGHPTDHSLDDVVMVSKHLRAPRSSNAA